MYYISHMGTRGKEIIEFGSVKLYSINKVAEILGVTQRTIMYKIKDGDLIAKKIGGKLFISDKNIEEFLLK